MHKFLSEPTASERKTKIIVIYEFGPQIYVVLFQNSRKNITTHFRSSILQNEKTTLDDFTTIGYIYYHQQIKMQKQKNSEFKIYTRE